MLICRIFSGCSTLALFFFVLFFNDTPTTEIYTLSLHDALPICAYLGVRVMHVALFAAGTEHPDVRRSAIALVPTSTAAPALLIAASALDGAAQTALWIAALAIDYVGGALRGIEGWRLSPGHFAERHGLIVIIALGESIVAIGVGAEDVSLDAAALLSAALGVVVSASLWWLYFDDSLAAVEHRLQEVTGA